MDLASSLQTWWPNQRNKNRLGMLVLLGIKLIQTNWGQGGALTCRIIFVSVVHRPTGSGAGGACLTQGPTERGCCPHSWSFGWSVGYGPPVEVEEWRRWWIGGWSTPKELWLRAWSGRGHDHNNQEKICCQGHYPHRISLDKCTSKQAEGVRPKRLKKPNILVNGPT